MGLSIRGYARHRGVSDGAVRKALKTGRITAEPDGSINPQRADRQWLANTDAVKQPATPAGEKPKSKSKIDKKPKRKKKSDDDDSFMAVRKRNEVLRAEMAELQLKEMQGALIDKESVIKHIFSLGRQERDTWLNWPTRVAAQMASELGIDEHLVLTTLDKFVRAQLEELADFTVKLD